MSMIYSKPFKTPSELITKLKSQNLLISDEKEAVRVLSEINYFRFKIYLRPFLDLSCKKYKKNSSFEQAYELYMFDMDLRSIVYQAIGHIEVKVRTKIEQRLTSFTNDPFWYLNDKYFIDKSKILTTKTSLKNEFLRSQDDFSVHYKNNYNNGINDDFDMMPPFWIISELSTFGNILAILETIDKKPFILPKNQNILDLLSKDFGANNLKELNSWLKLIRDIRNRVAHYSRIWNCNYREPSGIRKRLKKELLSVQPNKIYLFFVVLEFMYEKNIITCNIKREMNLLLKKYPIVSTFKDSMGIPKEWL